jgi:mono/diheme cytochrome c family protein
MFFMDPARIVPSFAALLLVAGCGMSRPPLTLAAEARIVVSHSQEVSSLSGGDPVRGRAAFLELQCHSCHRVAEDPSLPLPKGAVQGPLLHDLGAEAPEAVAWKIVTRTRLGPESLFGSRMADATSAMSERQLADLVAYLRDPGAGAKAAGR